MQTSKQYHSLALWVIMLISLSLLSACGGGSGDSNLDEQTPFGNVDEGKTITIDNNKFKLDPSSFSSGVTLNTENQPTEWKKGVDFGTIVQGEDTTTKQGVLTIANLYKTDNDMYYGAVVTENGQQVGLGLIRASGEALFLLDTADKNVGLILGNAIVLNQMNLNSYTFNVVVLDQLALNKYVGDYGCAEKGCKDALALGYLNEDEDEKFYHDVKININLKKEDSKLKASVPAWFVSDRFNSAEFTGLDGISEEFSKDGNDEYFSIDHSVDTDYESWNIGINGRLFAGSTDDVFIAGKYEFYYFDKPASDEMLYYGVFALEKEE